MGGVSEGSVQHNSQQHKPSSTAGGANSVVPHKPVEKQSVDG
jgi:hypothetical protein